MSRIGPEIHRTEVDGVPTYWADLPGKLTGTLMFRVGCADERLTNRGVTHMIEHLAMPPHARRLFECNATVEETRTLFWATGTEQEVTTFLAERTAQLSALPVDRLDNERGILRAEEEARRASPYYILLVEYFGARGFGLEAYYQYGLPGLTGEDLTDWAARHFTTGNATLWLTGPPPAGLRLDLPDGERLPAPAPEPIAAALPGVCYWGAGGGLTAAALVTRSLAANTTGWILSDRVLHRLRYELGITYASASGYDRWTADTAFVTVWPDVQEGREQEALEVMLAELDRLGEDGATEEELEHIRASVRRSISDPAQGSGSLDSAAYDELLQGDVWTTEKTVAMHDAMTAEDVAAAARTFRDSAVWVVPESVTMPDSGPAQLPPFSEGCVDGSRHRRRGTGLRRSQESIVVGAEGVSLDLGDGRAITVRYADCEALVVSENGDRELIGRDGFRVWLSASDWKRGDEIVKRIDEAIPADLRVTTSS